jgi:hypothetical protein
MGGSPICGGLDFRLQVDGVSCSCDTVLCSSHVIKTVVWRLGNSMDSGRFFGGFYSHWAHVDSDGSQSLSSEEGTQKERVETQRGPRNSMKLLKRSRSTSAVG